MNLQLGYSHDVNYDIPEGIKISVEKQTTLKITGFDKQLVGSVVSKIKTFRKIDLIKEKGLEKRVNIFWKKRKEKIMKLNTSNRKKFRVTNKLKNLPKLEDLDWVFLDHQRISQHKL